METKQEIKLEDVFNDEKRQAIKEFIDKQEIKHMIPKELFLLRGLPGSGKSTLAKSLDGIHIEADQFFMVEGEYKFDASKLKEVHNNCLTRTKSYMYIHSSKDTAERIIVSNTFTQEWEMKPYFELAEKNGYRVYSLIVENRHDGVNQHGVPADKLEQMKNRFNIKL